MSFKTLTESVFSTINNVFGEDSTYTPNGSDPISIKAVFDNAWVDVEGVASLKPTARIKLSDLTDKPAKGDQIQIEAVDYRITESREDGYGGTTLILQKV